MSNLSRLTLEPTTSSAISGDGRRALTNNAVGVATIWDLSTGMALASLKPHSPLVGKDGVGPTTAPFRAFIESADLNLDGSRALLGLNDGTAVIMDVGTGRELVRLHPPDEPPSVDWGVIRFVSFSGEYALVGFNGRRVGIWSQDGSKLKAFLRADMSSSIVGRPFVRDTLTTSISISPAGGHVFAAASDGTAALFDLHTTRELWSATEHCERIVGMHHDQERTAWATTAGKVWSRHGTAAAQCIFRSEVPWAEIAMNRNGVLARALDQSIRFWDWRGDEQVLFRTDEGLPEMWASNARSLFLSESLVCFPQGGRRLAIRFSGKTNVVELGQQLIRVTVSPQSDIVATNCWSPGSNVHLWSASDGARQHSLSVPGHCGCMAFSPDGCHVAIGELGNGGGLYDRTVYLYDLNNPEEPKKFKGHDWQIKQVGFSSDGKFLISLGDELLIWEISQHADESKWLVTRKRLDRIASAFAMSAAGLVILDEGNISVIRNGQEPLHFEAPIHFDVPWQLTPDGRQLLVGGNQAISIFDLATGSLLDHVGVPVPRPQLCPSHDSINKHGVSAAANLWNTGYGTFLAQGDGPRGWIQPISMSPEGIAIFPCGDHALLLHIGPGQISEVGIVPFSGRLRASRSVNGEVILINEEGQVFRSFLPR